MAIAAIGDIELNYHVLGDSGPFVLLVTGFGTRGDTWTPISRALAGRGFRAIQFDNRDIGRSSQQEGVDYDISDMAADALGLLDHLGVEQAHLVGISMGGMIAEELLVRFPQRFLRAVLLATWPGGAEAKMPEPALIQKLLSMGDLSDPAEAPGRLRALYQAITAPTFAEKSPDLIEMAINFALESPAKPAGLMRQIRAIGRFSIWDRLPDIKTPVLILHGDADPLIPHENGVAISRRIPGAELRTLPGVGHLIPLEAPFETFGAMMDFLT